MPKTASTIDSVSVLVNATAGESLIYHVTFHGANASFAITDVARSRRLLTSASPQSSAASWRRPWPLAADSFEMHTNHVAQFSYLGGATSYDYKVQLQTAFGLHTLVDVTYGSNTPTDVDRHDLQVTTV